MTAEQQKHSPSALSWHTNDAHRSGARSKAREKSKKGQQTCTDWDKAKSEKALLVLAAQNLLRKKEQRVFASMNWMVLSKFCQWEIFIGYDNDDGNSSAHNFMPRSDINLCDTIGDVGSVRRHKNRLDVVGTSDWVQCDENGFYCAGWDWSLLRNIARNEHRKNRNTKKFLLPSLQCWMFSLIRLSPMGKC